MTKRRTLRPTQTLKNGCSKSRRRSKAKLNPERYYGTAFRWFPDAYIAALKEPSFISNLVEELTEEPEPRASKDKVSQTPKKKTKRRKLAEKKRRAERNKRRRNQFLKQALVNAERHFKKVSK